jgi:HSP20 family protein
MILPELQQTEETRLSKGSPLGFQSFPEIRIEDAGKALVVIASVPGITKDNVKIEVRGNYLFLSGKSHLEQKEEGKNYFFKQSGSSSFYRSIPLPEKIDPKGTKVDLKNGILEIRLKKMKRKPPLSKKSKPRK